MAIGNVFADAVRRAMLKDTGVLTPSEAMPAMPTEPMPFGYGEMEKNLGGIAAGMAPIAQAFNPVGLLRGGANERLNRAEASLALINGEAPPVRRGAMRPGESGLALGAALLMNALGVDRGFISQMGQGYVGARQNQADMDYENAVNQRNARIEAAKLTSQIEMNRAQRLSEEANRIEGKIDKVNVYKQKVKEQEDERAFKTDQLIRELAGKDYNTILESFGKVGAKPEQLRINAALYLQRYPNAPQELRDTFTQAIVQAEKAEKFRNNKPFLMKSLDAFNDPKSSVGDRMRAFKFIAPYLDDPDFYDDPLLGLEATKQGFLATVKEASAFEKNLNMMAPKVKAETEAIINNGWLTMAKINELYALLPGKQAKLANEAVKASAMATWYQNRPVGSTEVAKDMKPETVITTLRQASDTLRTTARSYLEQAKAINTTPKDKADWQEKAAAADAKAAELEAQMQDMINNVLGKAAPAQSGGPVPQAPAGTKPSAGLDFNAEYEVAKARWKDASPETKAKVAAQLQEYFKKQYNRNVSFK